MAKSKKKDAENGQQKEKLPRKQYEQELARLQGELVKLQLWLAESKAKVVVLFEGRDAAGKGGVIKRITERVSPRVFRVVALPAPGEREKTMIFGQRYVENFPAGGEIALFDRSWYNRAGVERVMGFCTDEQYERFLSSVPKFEASLIAGGLQIIKYWFEVSQEEQTRRFEDRIRDPRKIWKLSPMDLESHHRWYDYSRARDRMFQATDTEVSPWHVVQSDDKRRARLNCISHLLAQIPYEETRREKVVLPDRQKPKGYVEPDYPWRHIPQRY
ncbi:MAG TPA: polyphosphate kinase 2 [Geminicoccus sp.]|uniref:polyphosphate kinase 2 n=1 Tax=Geminicoccus sp. TaxID=2024832 RepID=UPI002B9722FC|nr:polyphosphate kinase 2 [Geminicoccus sp.]HWL69610.1 polyphosphate kinase 2 [Geminicoccus sp.]